MSVLTQCDECGRKNIKVHRKHKGLKFCSACYKRTFSHRICPKCHKLSRLYDFDMDAICITCERAKPCIRCAAKEYRIGKKTKYGPVCNNCSSYFREPKPCSSCGALSQRLSTYKSFNVSKPICPKCANKYRGTCTRCRRHRNLTLDKSNAAVCKKCLEKGKIICPTCGSLYPAGYGKRCEDCYYKELFNRRMKLNINCIQSSNIKTLFTDFSKWLLHTYKTHKASIIINRHLDFFQELDAIWGNIPSPSELLKHFGAEGLRHHRTVMRFLDGTKGYALSTQEKRDHSDLQKIIAFTTGLKGNKEAILFLSHYRNTLLVHVNNKTLKVHTARLYLNAAKGLLKHGWPVTDKTISQYLSKSPGQKASSSKFISFLRKHLGSSASIQPFLHKQHGSGNKVVKKRLIKRIRMLADKALYQDQEVLSLSLQYYHGFPQSYKACIDNVKFYKNGEATYETSTHEYPLPNLS